MNLSSVQLKAGVPMTGGLGAKMMVKMGWKEGEGLGKDRWEVFHDGGQGYCQVDDQDTMERMDNGHGLNLIGFIKRIGRYRLLVNFMLPNSKRDKNVWLEIGSKG